MELMFLNSISTGEVFIVLLIVLMVFGADSIPKLARTFGRGVRQVKDATQEIQRDIQDSVNDTGNEIRRLDQDFQDTIDQDTPKL